MNVWPVNAPTESAFLVAYVIFAGVGFLAALGAQHLVALTLDPKEPGAQAGPAGTGLAPSSSSLLTAGAIPRGDDVLLVAASRGTAWAVSALLAAAVAEGWLRLDAQGRYTILRDAQPSTPSLAAFRDALGKLARPLDTLTIWIAAQRAYLDKLWPRYAVDLEERGLRRPLTRQLWVALPPVVVAAGLMALALARWAFIASDARLAAANADDPAVGVVMFLGVLACVAAALLASRRTTTAARYFRWLWDATRTLREDVAARRSTAIDEVALSAALEGLRFHRYGLGRGRRQRAQREHPLAPANACWPLEGPGLPVDVPTSH